jgi:hypothetical protein
MEFLVGLVLSALFALLCAVAAPIFGITAAFGYIFLVVFLACAFGIILIGGNWS